MLDSRTEIYAIADWKARFENSRSREVKALTWHQMPVLLADPVYATIVSSEGGAAIFGAFVALVQVAAQGSPRGAITFPNGKPHTASSLALLTRMPLELIENTLRVATELGWLVSPPHSADEVPTRCRPSADDLPTRCGQDRPKERNKERQTYRGISELSDSENEEFQALAVQIFRRHPADKRGMSDQVFIQELISHLGNYANPLRTLREIEKSHKAAAVSRKWTEGFGPKLIAWVTTGDWQNAEEMLSAQKSTAEETPLFVDEDAA